MYTFTHVAWEIALLMTHSTVPLRPNFPAKLKLQWEALQSHSPDHISAVCISQFSQLSEKKIKHFQSFPFLVSLRLNVILCYATKLKENHSCFAVSVELPVIFIRVHLCRPRQRLTTSGFDLKLANEAVQCTPPQPHQPPCYFIAGL